MSALDLEARVRSLELEQRTLMANVQNLTNEVREVKASMGSLTRAIVLSSLGLFFTLVGTMATIWVAFA